MHTSNASRNKLRRELRQRRRAVTTSYKYFAANRIKQLLARSGWLHRGQRIAVYLATDEEINLQPLINLAWQRGCKVFIPQIVNMQRSQMIFCPFKPGSLLIKHRWGMQQLIVRSSPVAVRMLDVVLVPTVGFDDAGHRLGMGGGFYDRYFAAMSRLQHHKPILIGVAYSFQKISAIEVQAHDIQMDAMLTEHALIRFNR